MLQKLIKWLLFSAVISVVPLFSTYIILLLHSNYTTITTIIARGELQLISVALLANGIGEVVSNDNISKTIKIALSGLSTILLLLISIWYGAIVSSLIAQNSTSTPQVLEFPSLIIFLVSFFISACCVVVGENKIKV